MLGAKISKSPRCHPISRSSLLGVLIYTCDITVAAVKAYAVVYDLLPALESPFGASTHTALPAPAALFDEEKCTYLLFLFGLWVDYTTILCFCQELFKIFVWKGCKFLVLYGSLRILLLECLKKC